MAREHNPLTTNGSILNMVNEFQGGRAAIGAMLSVDPIRFKNQLHEQKGMRISTETALTIQEFTGRTDFAEAVAFLSGGVFVKLPDFDVVDGDINEKFIACIKTLGEMGAMFQEIIADDILTKREHKNFTALKHRLCAEAASIVVLTGRLHDLKVEGYE